MLKQAATKGALDACARFGVDPTKIAAAPGGLLSRAMSFGEGQMGAAKDLFRNLRGGLGGAMNPSVITGAVPAQSMDLARASQRQQALGNLRTLAPSLAVGGGLWALHRHNQALEEQRRQQAMQPQPYQGGPAY